MKIYKLAFPRSQFDWSQIDWSKTTDQISQETGFSKSYVSNMRKRFAPDTKGKRRSEWSFVDWSKSNMELSQEMNKPVIRIQEMREKHSPSTVDNAPGDADWSDVDWYTEMNVDIAERKNVNVNVVVRARETLAPETIGRFNEWAVSDW